MIFTHNNRTQRVRKARELGRTKKTPIVYTLREFLNGAGKIQFTEVSMNFVLLPMDANIDVHAYMRKHGYSEIQISRTIAMKSPEVTGDHISRKKKSEFITHCSEVANRRLKTLDRYQLY